MDTPTVTLQMAVAGTGFLTHLTIDGDLTLCRRQVLAIPEAISLWCQECVTQQSLLVFNP